MILYENWIVGKSVEELLQDDKCKSVARKYLSNEQVIKIYKYPDGVYKLVDDGRHRVAAAQELGLYIPVVVVGEYVYKHNIEIVNDEEK